MGSASRFGARFYSPVSYVRARVSNVCAVVQRTCKYWHTLTSIAWLWKKQMSNVDTQEGRGEREVTRGGKGGEGGEAREGGR
eukprot:1340735-Rhodomonas_salina.1